MGKGKNRKHRGVDDSTSSSSGINHNKKSSGGGNNNNSGSGGKKDDHQSSSNNKASSSSTTSTTTSKAKTTRDSLSKHTTNNNNNNNTNTNNNNNNNKSASTSTSTKTNLSSTSTSNQSQPSTTSSSTSTSMPSSSSTSVPRSGITGSGIGGGGNGNGNERSGQRSSLYQWCVQERQGIFWVIGCAILGGLFGFGIGSGWLTGEINAPPHAWRVALGMKIRSTTTYHVLTFQKAPWEPFADTFFLSSSSSSKRADGSTSTSSSSRTRISGRGTSRSSSSSLSSIPDDPRSIVVTPTDPEILRNDPSHPIVYAVLREAIVRENGGYVHPDLGILTPAPCGAARGLGMVRDAYHQCQTSCLPGVAKEKLAILEGDSKSSNSTDSTSSSSSDNNNNNKPIKYKQEEVLVKVPLGYQMTRSVALATLLPKIPGEIQRKANPHELDDAALLVLLLAHERGVGQYSRWLPYIASLPTEPSCGYSKRLRPFLLDSVEALREEIGLDVNGWPAELLKASQYADQIAKGLARDYGSFIQHPEGLSAVENIHWALCQVASRGTAGSQKHGTLRMIPLLDMINHDAAAGGFVELTGKERLSKGDFVEAMEEDSGAFIVRSLRHGKRKALRIGQELLVNYNVPHYSALDWFISLGFVPSERYVNKWQKIESALPKVRRDGPFFHTGSTGVSDEEKQQHEESSSSSSVDQGGGGVTES